MRKFGLLLSIVFVISLVLAVPASAAGANYLWHTFFGAAGDDRAYAVETDSQNCSIIVGRSLNTWNGPADQDPLHAHPSPGSNFSCFIMKMDDDGNYLWHTFLWRWGL